MGDFGVSDKESKKNSSVNKVQSLEAFPNSSKEMTTTMMMMMVHHNHHHHRPLSPFDDDSCAAGDADGPRSYVSLCNTNNNNDNHINGVASASVSAAAIHSGGASATVRNLQPFDISTSYSTPSVTTTTLPAFKSPGGMAGFPFTNAQWKELERQAMIYKYMMASVPVPPDLLIPISLQAATRSPLENGFNLRLSSSTDPEPGRCRRTDGKKWRCSRDVAPNHKYCERHMHRGRPRSRKPVEVHANSNISNDNNNQQLKKPRYDSHPFHASDVTVAIPNPTIRKNGPLSQPYHESLLSFDKFSDKASNFESLASVSSTKEPRGLDWMLKGDPVSLAASNPEWQSLMQNRVGLNTQSYPNYQEIMYPNSHTVFHSELDHQSRRFPPFLNSLVVPMENPQSQKPRGFIDAWSNAETDEKYANPNKSSVASNNKLSLSSLDLSMGGGGTSSVEEEIGNIQMGLGLMEPDGNTEAGSAKTHFTNWLTPAAPWVASTTPGGPLAEVLRLNTVAAANEAASNSSSPVITNAESSRPLAKMVSSSSGVLQKTLASLSDSSSSSSPTIASSRANSEIAMMWFNQSKLATST